MTILKYYANLDDCGQTHYRESGSGSPLVLLHASPMSSELMVPIMQQLADVANVIAPDTPGYGMSDPLPQSHLDQHQDLTPYTDWLLSFINAKGLDKIGLYGTATGAQIAIEFARNHPDRTLYVVLDNAAHFTDQQREEIMRGYFPDVSPQADGSHLNLTWNMAAGLFQWFPWYVQDEAHRISNAEPPVAAVQATTMAYLTAGVDYAQAYRRAFANEDAQRVTEISVPVRVIRWQGSILKKYSDAFDQFEWPEHIQMCHCDAQPADRFRAIHAAVSELA